MNPAKMAKGREGHAIPQLLFKSKPLIQEMITVPSGARIPRARKSVLYLLERVDAGITRRERSSSCGF